MQNLIKLALWIVCLINYFDLSCGFETVHAINFGGPRHVDTNGISYEADSGTYQRETYKNTYKNVSSADNKLYQSIFYGKQVNYEVPVNGSGKYLLLIKFVSWESYSAVFDMVLNGQHPVRSNFTFKKDYTTAYDHYVFFSVCDDNDLYYKSNTSKIVSNNVTIYLESPEKFITSVSALALLKGDVESFPVLPTAELYSVEDRDELLHHPCAATPTTTDGATPSTYSTSFRPNFTTPVEPPFTTPVEPPFTTPATTTGVVDKIINLFNIIYNNYGTNNNYIVSKSN